MRKLSEVVVQTGRHVYRDILSVALFSTVCAVVLIPFVFFMPIRLALLALPFVLALLGAGVLEACHRLLKGEKSGVLAMLAGVGKHFGASVVFALFGSLFVLILVSSWWYYGNRSGTFYFSLAVFQTYFVTMVFVSQLYTLPLVVQEKLGIFTAIGRSVKLFVAHPGYTFGAFLQLVFVTILLGVTVIGFAALYAGIAGIYANLVTANVLPKRDGEPQGGGTAEGGERESGSGRHSGDVRQTCPT